MIYLTLPESSWSTSPNERSETTSSSATTGYSSRRWLGHRQRSSVPTPTGSVEEKAAALLHSLARNHALVDGNKRLALAAAIAFSVSTGAD
ncbi:MAG: Fic family protein [Nocardioidaceae bacterium]